MKSTRMSKLDHNPKVTTFLANALHVSDKNNNSINAIRKEQLDIDFQSITEHDVNEELLSTTLKSLQDGILSYHQSYLKKFHTPYHNLGRPYLINALKTVFGLLNGKWLNGHLCSRRERDN